MSATISTYHLWTSGCQMNEADSRSLAARLEACGLQAVGRVEDADIAILNTCVVRQQPEDKAVARLEYLRHLKKKRPGLLVAVMGCLVGIREADSLMERFPFVDAFLPPSEPGALFDALADRGVLSSDAIEEGLDDWVLPASHSGVSAYIPAVLGCSFACTYCVIPYRRGPERSRPFDDIVAEAHRLADGGVREATLLGQIIDRYGLDLDPRRRLAELLMAIAGIEGLHRVRFLTSHPNWMDNALFEAVAQCPKIMPCFEIALQSGSDEVLRRMKRGYSADQFRHCVANARAAVPEASIQTDVIVGFPGETEAQFLQTVDLVREIEFDMVHLAKYSPRPRTYSARHFPDDVPPEEKERRRIHLEAVQQEIQTLKCAALVGQTVEVMIEDRRKERWFGRTPQNKLVFFEDEQVQPGDLAQVRVDWAGPYSLVGNLCRV